MATQIRMCRNIIDVTFLFFAFYSFFLDFLAAEDTLKPGGEVRFSSPLVSANDTFNLGFFSLTGEAAGYYLGLWYADDPGRAKLWVANRNEPIPDETGVLTLDDRGNLKISYSEGRKEIVLYKSPSVNVSAEAILQDDGNFVLKEHNADGSETEKRVLWQSFDNPTDTLLPGMKLGINRRTKQKWVITSWLNSYPLNGSFTLEWDPEGRRLVIKYRGVIRWASGEFNSSSLEFKFLKPQQPNYSYRFVHVSTGDEDYFSYSIEGFRVSDRRRFMPQWFLREDGVLWGEGRIKLADADSCYSYNTNNGCQRWKSPECRTHDKYYAWITLDHYTKPPTKTALSKENSSISDCREFCWMQCDCFSFTVTTSSDFLCNFWYASQFTEDEDYSDASMDVENLDIVYVITPNTTEDGSSVSEAEPPQNYHPIPKRKARGMGKWIGIGTAATVAFVALVTGMVCFLWRRKKDVKVSTGDNETWNESYILGLASPEPNRNSPDQLENARKVNGLKLYNFKSIMEATDNFSAENKLGEGGFGQVYKGILPEGREIAVKRLSEGSRQGLLEFKNELQLIAELRHANLVRLLGCCIHGEEKILIYEYMPNKSLDNFLFDPAKGKLLDWNKRFRIIERIAQGLLYLHKYSRLKVIHRDLKASNILLDENLNPKISDFGMARIFGKNELEAYTMRVVGTFGYMSPEYAMEGIFSVKSDVFSLGVIILEIISGKKNNKYYHLSNPLNLVGYAWELWRRGTPLELRDPSVGDSCVEKQFVRCIHVSLLCLENNAADRPNMSDVVSMLTQENKLLPSPKNPRFFIGNNHSDEDSTKKKKAICLLNDLSISVTQE